MEFLSEYGLFVAKAITIVVAILIVIIVGFAASHRNKGEADGEIEVSKLNDKFDDMEHALKASVMSEEEFKQAEKQQKKAEKQKAKEKKKAKKDVSEDDRKKRIYVLEFDGDTSASEVANLREEITAVLTLADKQDEVVVKLESPGGMVHTYGLAASQLNRIRQKEIPLTITVDAVAASGGYMMACIGNKILAAPFAMIGSIGVIAQLPNFSKLLKKNDIDFEMFTAGEYKRTVTMFGENTEQDREKFREELEDTHVLFKNFVSEHRPQLNISEVATGEAWYGKRALEKHLIDDIQTSDEYLLSQWKEADIFEVNYVTKKSLQEKLGFAASTVADRVVGKLLERFRNDRFF